jgi:hypothetical protein
MYMTTCTASTTHGLMQPMTELPDSRKKGKKLCLESQWMANPGALPGPPSPQSLLIREIPAANSRSRLGLARFQQRASRALAAKIGPCRHAPHSPPSGRWSRVSAQGRCHSLILHFRLERAIPSKQLSHDVRNSQKHLTEGCFNHPLPSPPRCLATRVPVLLCRWVWSANLWMPTCRLRPAGNPRSIRTSW